MENICVFMKKFKFYLVVIYILCIFVVLNYKNS